MQKYHEVEWNTKQVSEFWDYQSKRSSVAENYFGAHCGPQIAKRTLKYVTRSKPTRILDLGCGSGHLLKHIFHARRDATLYGIDFSPESIHVAQETFASMSPLPEFQLIDGYPTSLPAKTRDAVNSTEVVEHLSNDMLDAMVIECMRLLKKGGILVITTPNEENLERSSTCCPNCNSTFHIWQHVRSWSAASLTSYMSQRGFRKVLAEGTLLEPMYARLVFGLARKFRVTKRRPPHLLAIYRK
jgi:2-polyprenyl-3-methyl-5-hydroxy-6-metoxy-1,4-benzoquinol methylase